MMTTVTIVQSDVVDDGDEVAVAAPICGKGDGGVGGNNDADFHWSTLDEYVVHCPSDECGAGEVDADNVFCCGSPGAGSEALLRSVAAG